MNSTGPAGSRSFADTWRAMVVSFLGLGYAPVASGTFGTLGGVAIVLALVPLRHQEWFHFGTAMVAVAVLCVAVGVLLGPWAERHYGRKDPGAVVIDEVAGYCVTLFQLDGFPGWQQIVAAFFVFRLFDVLKPFPARRIESLPKGWGIMLDDVFAGLYAWMLVHVMTDYLDWPGW